MCAVCSKLVLSAVAVVLEHECVRVLRASRLSLELRCVYNVVASGSSLSKHTAFISGCLSDAVDTSSRVEPEPRLYVGMGNSTAYPEVHNTPIVNTADLLRCSKAEQAAVAAAMGNTDDDWEPARDPVFARLEDLGTEGPGPDDVVDPSDQVVLFWHCNHQLVLKEWLHQLRRFPIVIDGSPGDGSFGVVCMTERAKYMPMPLCGEHAAVLQRVWQNWVTDNVLLKDLALCLQVMQRLGWCSCYTTVLLHVVFNMHCEETGVGLWFKDIGTKIQNTATHEDSSIKEVLVDLQPPDLARHKRNRQVHSIDSPPPKQPRVDPASGGKPGTTPTTPTIPSPHVPGSLPKLPPSIAAALGQSTASSSGSVPQASMHGGVLPLSALVLGGAKPGAGSTASGESAGPL